MRLVSCTLSALFLLACCALAAAQDKPKTDAQRDDLAGPVRSVASTRLSQASKEQMRGIEFDAVSSCELCEFDRDGNKISDGRIMDGTFVGKQTLIQHNPDGTRERITTTVLPPPAPGSTPGPPYVERELDGPFGDLDRKAYLGDELQFHVVSHYDAKGNLSEAWSFDGSGAIKGHETLRWTEDGQNLERVGYGEGDVLGQRWTWDPETDETRLLVFDPSGAVVESWSVAHHKIVSFWEDVDRREHPHLMMDEGESGGFTFKCEKSSGCKVYHHDSRYAGPGKRNILHTNFFDSAGKLIWTADYEYDLDAQGNWTHRKVWATFPDGARVLSSEDARTISYWEQ